MLRYFDGHGAGHGGVEIGVVEHDEGRIAAQLQPDLFHPDAACRISSLPTSVEPVKPTKRTAGMFAENLADRGRVAGDDVQHARRQAGALRQFAQRQRRERRLRRRLDHAGAAGGQGGRAFAGDHRRREIPRRDRRHHADRLAQSDDARVGPGRGNGLAIDPLGLLGEKFDETRGIVDLAARLGQWLALLAGHDHAEIVARRDHQFEPFAQQGGALLGGHAPPRFLRPLRGLDGLGRLRRAAVGHAAPAPRRWRDS